MTLTRFCAFGLAFAGGSLTVRADDEPLFPRPRLLPSVTHENGGGLSVTVGPQPYYYLGWEHSPDLQTHWSMADMSLGSQGATFLFFPGVSPERDFFRVRAINLWSPGDADDDGMDDVWELQNGLDPVNPGDAAGASVFDPGKTNLTWYRQRFGTDGTREYFSDEISIINSPGSVSLEVSVFTFGLRNDTLQEALSAEVSIYQSDERNLTILEAVSGEVSVFLNSSGILSSQEALSAEVSIFQHAAALDPASEALSEEVSIFQSTVPPTYQSEAISAEVSVLK